MVGDKSGILAIHLVYTETVDIVSLELLEDFHGLKLNHFEDFRLNKSSNKKRV